MTLHGRPLRFLAIVGLSWLCARLYFVSPFASEDFATPPQPIVAAREAPPPVVAERYAGIPFIEIVPSESRDWRDPGAAAARLLARQPAILTGRAGSRPPVASESPFPPLLIASGSMPDLPPFRAIPRAQGSVVAGAPPSSRLSGYAYVFVRSGRDQSALAGEFGQLGGSQAGVRIDYAVTRTLALTARATSPLGVTRDREVALGVKWRPARFPIDLTVERRQSIGRGGRNAVALMATGGFGPVALPADFRLEAYGSAGMVGLKRRDAFIEGQVTVLRDVASAGPTTLAIGAGTWGGAQPGVERLDIGPRARVALPLGKRGVGLSLDYRQRVAGSARPGSGATLTLDTSF